MVKQTAGRTILGNFAPKFAALNDDVLFGEVWSREEKLQRIDREGHDRCVSCLPFEGSQKEWRDAGGNGRTSDAHCFLRWLA